MSMNSKLGIGNRDHSVSIIALFAEKVVIGLAAW